MALDRLTIAERDRDTTDLDLVLAESWTLLELGARRASESFHMGVLANWDGMMCQQRTLVLRVADALRRQLICHTDARAPKLHGLRAYPRVSWLFYDPSRKLQLRLAGTARIHGDDSLADLRWAASTLSARRCYLSHSPPGTLAPVPTSGLTAPFISRSPTEDESHRGRHNFAAVATEIDELECLHLDAVGHRRARFRWVDGVWTGDWLVP